MKRPDLQLVVAINRAIREDDEWFEEPDDLGRLKQVLAAIDLIDDPIAGAAVLAFRIARAQSFGEGNKRTALLAARWILDNNQVEGESIIPLDDREFADLLIRAASGFDVQNEIIDLFNSRCK